MSPKVLVVAEAASGHLVGAALEAIAVAQSLAGGTDAVAGVALGSAANGVARELGERGVTRVLVVPDPRLDVAPTAAHAAAVVAAATHWGATTIVLGGTAYGRDLTGRLAVRWNAAAATGVTEVRSAGTTLEVRRPIFGGRATETRRLDGGRQVVALRPHAFTPAASAPGSPTIETVPLGELPTALTAPKRTGIEAAGSGSGPSLGDAPIVVSGGRGVRAPENFRLVDELAASLGAAVGASRAVTDAGWRPVSYQVGQTGKSVSPQLYIAVGISGAIQHLVGMISSRTIVAINSDASAPIFKVADYGIVGDLFQILPALTAEVRKARGI